MARRRNSSRRRRGGGFAFLYKLLSMLLICGAIVAALTLFFRVETVLVRGQQRYTEEQVREATGIQSGDNLYLMNKNAVVESLLTQLPYIETIQIDRKLPDTILVEISECGMPLALVQDGRAWLISPRGKIVDSLEKPDGYGVISGCRLLSPTVGTPLLMTEEDALRQTSLLSLLAALEDADMLEDVHAIRMEEPDYLAMDYTERFTVRIPYGADYPYKLRFLQAVIADEKIQDNMVGTFDMCGEDGRTNFIQNVR